VASEQKSSRPPAQKKETPFEPQAAIISARRKNAPSILFAATRSFVMNNGADGGLCT